MAGGSPITLCDARHGRGGTWNDDGLILFGDQLAGLQRIPASGGTPSPVTQLNQEAGETAHYYPQFLPGGKEFLYLVRHADAEKMGIFVGSLDGKPATRIVQTEYKAVYDAVAGRLSVHTREWNADGAPAGVESAKADGRSGGGGGGGWPCSVNGFADFSVSGNGTLFYGRGTRREKCGSGGGTGQGSYWKQSASQWRVGVGFSLSPDGSRVAYSAGARQSDVWVLELARGVSTRITFSSARAAAMVSGREAPLLQQWKRHPPESGRRLRRGGVGGEGDICGCPRKASRRTESICCLGAGDILTLPLTGERKPEPYLQTKYAEFGATFSPDGRWVAYRSDESGRLEIYVQGFPERRGKWLVSAAGGRHPQWRADGKELYWRAPDNTLMAATVELQAAGVRVGRAGAALPAAVASTFQPARDGRRFLVLEPEGGQQPDRPMVVIQNWAAGLPK